MELLLCRIILLTFSWLPFAPPVSTALALKPRPALFYLTGLPFHLMERQCC